MEPIIQVDGLVKRYKKSDHPAVDGITFEVRPGELFAFLGPNGAGKTTTISILTTTLAKTAGTVRIAGHDLDREATAVRRSIGIIFQSPSLDLHLSGEENIRLHVALYGLYGYRPFYRTMPGEYRSRIEELAGVVGLGDEVFRPLKTYSGGMKRKLEIIRSLMHRPSVLFLDEPTSGLDPVSRHALWQYLRHVRNTDGDDDLPDDPLPRGGGGGRPRLRDRPWPDRDDRDARRDEGRAPRALDHPRRG
jgi:ABC-2 type transport system ATP-binding protein